MNIGFDAKRAYHNTTGLGYYSRTLIDLLSKQYPEHFYYLFNPKHTPDFAQWINQQTVFICVAKQLGYKRLTKA